MQNPQSTHTLSVNPREHKRDTSYHSGINARSHATSAIHLPCDPGKATQLCEASVCHLRSKDDWNFIVRVKLYRRAGNREGSRGKQPTSGSSVQGSVCYFTFRVGRKIDCVSNGERISSHSTLLSRCPFHAKGLL